MQSGRKPAPRPDGNTAAYWSGAKAGKLLLPRCEDCGRICFPPLPRCKYCLSEKLAWAAMSGRGTIDSFCVVHTDLVGGFSPPYAVAQVQLEEQADLLLPANIVGARAADLRIGAPVEVVFESREDGVVVPQFRLAS
ncbi:MAG TPA: Zn-ribbon domain-containing OB-fold protein [Ramlibacter sp.]|uniref:Zn-ribbon domain-containing OB-fold protein n=1 Tax=Ramlibacter sp. TaxID=1917967 RepID=UPI002CB8D47B|nr:Zn-ribbon domain-containing OB-fold protein [Ramlibacter sp.]HVZ46481.1 Zn-ribbon domain-containing OB-fold protein [Ramlibacter sp.]